MTIGAAVQMNIPDIYTLLLPICVPARWATSNASGKPEYSHVRPKNKRLQGRSGAGGISFLHKFHLKREVTPQTLVNFYYLVSEKFRYSYFFQSCVNVHFLQQGIVQNSSERVQYPCTTRLARRSLERLTVIGVWAIIAGPLRPTRSLSSSAPDAGDVRSHEGRSFYACCINCDRQKYI